MLDADELELFRKLEEVAGKAERLAGLDIDTHGATTRRRVRSLAIIAKGLVLAFDRDDRERIDSACASFDALINIVTNERVERAVILESHGLEDTFLRRTHEVRSIFQVVRNSLGSDRPDSAHSRWREGDFEAAAKVLVFQVRRVIEEYPNGAVSITGDIRERPFDWKRAEKEVADELRMRSPDSGAQESHLDSTAEQAVRVALRAIGYPASKAKSLFDADRKRAEKRAGPRGS